MISTVQWRRGGGTRGSALSAEWLSNSSDLSGRLAHGLEGMLHKISRPQRLRRLRQLLLVLLAIWAVLALSRLVWGLLPGSDEELPEQAEIINPVSTAAPVQVQEVDIERMVSWHLFGEAGAEAPPAAEIQELPAQASAREGIEEGARETRLDLKLRGVIASTDDGLGYAIIEHKKQQAVYAVEDPLPVSGKVALVKVMPRQVVLDNGGTYELLTLFEETELDGQLPRDGAPSARAEVAPRQLESRVDVDTTTLARSYRDRLYQNPQSLAEVVSVNAVRENGELMGYRIVPGAKREQFERLGFKAGDLVTAINGIALDDPANTMRLYQTMRNAPEAVFELQRGGAPVTLSVSLADAQDASQ